MKKVIILIVFITCYGSLKAQWDSIAMYNQVISDLKVFNGNLFIVGDFTKYQNYNCYWSSYYNGSIIVCNTNTIGGSGIRAIEVFNGELYSVDALYHGYAIGVGKWNGSSWQDGGSTDYSHSLIYADGNDLYVGSDNGVIRKKTGNGSFQTFYNFTNNNIVSSICRYGNELIFAGSFDTIGGIPAKNIAKWNGTIWQPLGSGISIGTQCMAVYNNELYVAGKITTAGGNTVSNIAKWNGSTWSSVGGGITSVGLNGVQDMKVYNGALYIVGDFTQIGSINTSNVATWNGYQWTGLNLVHNDNFANCIEVYNNKIYVGTFSFYHSHLFRYMGLQSVEENGNVIVINIYPNPVINNLIIETPDKTTIDFMNISGQKIKSIISNSVITSIDLKNISSGIYFVKAVTDKGFVIKKIIKE